MNPETVKEKLKHYILTEILRNPGYSIETDEPLISGGLIDSFSLVHIAVFVENEFGVKIPDTEMTAENMDTIDAMTLRIMQEAE